MTKRKKIYIGIATVALIGIVAIKGPLYWQGVGVFNKIVAQDHKIDVSQATSHSLLEEKNRLHVLLDDDRFELYRLTRLSSGGMMGASQIKSREAANILATFNTYNDNDRLFNDEKDYVIDVILSQWMSGNVEVTHELLNKLTTKDLTTDQRNRLAVVEAAIALSFYDRSALAIALENITQDEYLPIKESISDYLELYYDDGDKKDLYTVTYEMRESNRYLGYFDDLLDAVKSYEKKDYENLKGTVSDQQVGGQITLNGQPIEGIMVYLDYSRGMSSIEGFSSAVAITDSNGTYGFETVGENLLGVNLIVPWQRFHETQFVSRWENPILRTGEDLVVDFSFDNGVRFTSLSIEDDYLTYEIYDPLASEDRQYYMTIEFAESTYINNRSFIEWPIAYDQLKGRIALAEIHKRTDLPISYISSYNPLDLERFIEPFYLTGDYLVEPYVRIEDRDRYVRNGLMTDKLKSLVHFNGADDYNQGDKLLDSGQYEEAIAWYAANPSQHNLRVLIELVSRGTEIIEIDEFMRDLTGGDLKQATVYAKQLMDTYGVTTARIDQMAGFYKEMENFQVEEEWLLKHLEIDTSPYTYFTLAYCLLHQGEYQEGIMLLLNHGDMIIDGDRYYGYFILGDETQALPSEVSALMNQLDSKDDFQPLFDLIKSGDNKKAYQWLMAQEDGDLKNFYLLNYLDSYTYSNYDFEAYKKTMGLDDKLMFMDYYREVYKKTKNEDIKRLYELLKESHNWLR